MTVDVELARPCDTEEVLGKCERMPGRIEDVGIEEVMRIDA